MSADPAAMGDAPPPALPAPVWLLGLPFHPIDLPGAMAAVRRAARQRQRLFISTPNVNFAVAAAAQPAFRDSVLRSDLSLADGMPLVWLARRLGLPITQRVAGSDLFAALRRPPADGTPPLKVYFFGGPPGVAAQAGERLNAERGGLVCVGHASPGFGSVEAMSAPELIDDINRSGADFLVVALGAQKGQAWILHNLPRLKPPVVSHLGAVVNFVAGAVRRAPPWMQRTGLEWLWRIREEPGLVKRYAGDGLALARLVWDELRAERQGAYAGAGRLMLRSPDGRVRLSRVLQHWSVVDHQALLRWVNHAPPGDAAWTVQVDEGGRPGRTAWASLAMAAAQARVRGVTLTLPEPLARRLPG
ncbi:WecB/TagA/CpsF family glycosyltransferase [Aquabacterium sp. J223]|uniref:WecB/TagA/CpsF family glycosyltransferase n=1 Tax=Aquabacterium sp. J223 TaxID=2898431 RepID=UPI00289A1A8B|nr:WecB/TagA/CpsF family glycosyltransferase [Aquabacterium sp. J223]